MSIIITIMKSNITILQKKKQRKYVFFNIPTWLESIKLILALKRFSSSSPLPVAMRRKLFVCDPKKKFINVRYKRICSEISL